MNARPQAAARLVAEMVRLAAAGLAPGTSGNASVRTRRGFLITPSAMEYEAMEAHSLVELDLSGQRLLGRHKPSTEWPFHAAIYRARGDAGAVVHLHSPHATAIACTRRPIPAFHYMVAVAGGDCIPCAPYAPFGSEELAHGVAEALALHDACLLANHGLVAVGADIRAAVRMAETVEELARQYLLALAAGGPVLLSDDEMAEVRRRFAGYRAH